MTKAAPKTRPANKPGAPESSQIDKFKQAARNLDCDDDEQRFDERVKQLVKLKPAPETPGE